MLPRILQGEIATEVEGYGKDIKKSYSLLQCEVTEVEEPFAGEKGAAIGDKSSTGFPGE
jgi:hypothetical protein